ncbi:MAG: hypothetical protein ACFE0I_02485 [Elainellaceae cyanobacterium]
MTITNEQICYIVIKPKKNKRKGKLEIVFSPDWDKPIRPQINEFMRLECPKRPQYELVDWWTAPLSEAHCFSRKAKAQKETLTLLPDRRNENYVMYFFQHQGHQFQGKAFKGPRLEKKIQEHRMEVFRHKHSKLERFKQ